MHVGVPLPTFAMMEGRIWASHSTPIRADHSSIDTYPVTFAFTDTMLSLITRIALTSLVVGFRIWTIYILHTPVGTQNRGFRVHLNWWAYLALFAYVLEFGVSCIALAHIFHLGRHMLSPELARAFDLIMARLLVWTTMIFVLSVEAQVPANPAMLQEFELNEIVVAPTMVRPVTWDFGPRAHQL